VTGDELIKLQSELGLSNVALANLVKRSVVSVWKWRSGDVSPVPEYVGVILEQYAARSETPANH